MQSTHSHAKLGMKPATPASAAIVLTGVGLAIGAAIVLAIGIRDFPVSWSITR